MGSATSIWLSNKATGAKKQIKQKQQKNKGCFQITVREPLVFNQKKHCLVYMLYESQPIKYFAYHSNTHAYFEDRPGSEKHTPFVTMITTDRFISHCRKKPDLSLANKKKKTSLYSAVLSVSLLCNENYALQNKMIFRKSGRFGYVDHWGT